MIPSFLSITCPFATLLIASLDSSIKRSIVKWKSKSFGIFDNLIYLIIRDLKIEVEIPLLKGSIWESIAHIFILFMSRT